MDQGYGLPGAAGPHLVDGVVTSTPERLSLPVLADATSSRPLRPN